jgi:hypothetical protein
MQSLEKERVFRKEDCVACGEVTVVVWYGGTVG